MYLEIFILIPFIKHAKTSEGDISNRQIKIVAVSYTHLDVYKRQEYVNQYKMDKARYLLKNSELPIDQIAHLLGYHQRSSFEKEFKKLAGKTPSQYRKIFSDTYL